MREPGPQASGAPLSTLLPSAANYARTCPVDLSDDQEQLLTALVEARRALPADHRSPFLVPPYDGRGSRYFLMLPRPSAFRLTAYLGDVTTLIEAGLLRAEHGQRGLKAVDLTNRAFAAYDAIRAREGGATARREAYVHRYLDDAATRARYPAALAKLDEADALLWADGGDQSLSTIGHLCREALQLFAAVLVAEVGVAEAEPDPARTKNRVRAALDQLGAELGGRERNLLTALLDYWSAVNGVVQRQEHGSQAAERPLTWDDARRVVFHTAVVMLEIAASLQRATRQ
jgi:hypothetical protein